jgi:tetratricopeptide (TPR) repeat protein
MPKTNAHADEPIFERFQLRTKLGAGGYGVVHEAWDNERQMTVALKRLHHLEPTAIYRFKREFRSLTDVVHPNLVQLYELLSDGAHWYFTMELVDGVPLLEWVRPGAHGQPHNSRLEATTIASGVRNREEPSRAPRALSAALDLERLRASFLQLAEGVYALHTAGKLHRDLKSQNVLVDRTGRVVLLDFGLVLELGPQVDAADRDIVGTPLYMAPEQGIGGELTEAVDWYAVGVTLYLALTGRFPFEGQPIQVFYEKQTRDPLPPCALDPSVPSDLDALCMKLLRRVPSERPTGSEVLALLGQRQARPITGSVHRTELNFATDRPFVGRAHELALLHAAAAEVAGGRARTMLVHGPSGMGKSALVRHFLAEVTRANPTTLLLEGRCYATEAVPYKAIDGVVDSLGRFLATQSDEALLELLPRHFGELALLFPTLRRVPFIDTLGAKTVQLPDPIERRRRAFAALRALLRRLAKRQRVIIYVDDLHWGDIDSALAITELIQTPDAPALFWVGTYRSDEAKTSPFLRQLRALNPSLAQQGSNIEVGALSQDDAAALVSALLHLSPDDVRMGQIALDAAGSPLFIDQLATAHNERPAERPLPGATPTEAVTLADVIGRRLDQLPRDARSILEVLSIAGKPVDDSVLRVASGFSSLESSGLALLRSSRLVRTLTIDGRTHSETYHDRIRETVSTTMPRDRAATTHRGLAQAFEDSGSDDVDQLATHWRAAGDTASAFDYTVRAADYAATQLAFDRAALLYREAIEMRTGTSDGALEVRLGDALRDAGRGAEAASAYTASASATVDAEVALDLRRQAGEQLLASGHHDEANRVLAEVLREIGMPILSNPTLAMGAFVFRRAQLSWKGMSFKARPPESVSARMRLKMDVCWSMAIGLSMIDFVRAGAFQSMHMLLALESGDARRVARAASVEVPFSATGGSGSRARTAALIKRAHEVAAQVNDSQVNGLLAGAVGAAPWLEGDWPNGLAVSTQGEEVIRTQCTGMAWNLDTTTIVRFDCLYRMGRWNEIIQHVPQVLVDAQARGDLYMEIYSLIKFGTLARLANDQPELAAEALSEAIKRWSMERFSILHFWELYGQAEVSLYRRKGEDAAKRVRDATKAVKSSLLLQVQLYRICWIDLRGRTELSAAATEPKPAAALRSVEKAIRELQAEEVGWATGLAALLRGGMLATRGDASGAEGALRDAIRDLSAVHMNLHAEVARARMAELAGDVAGIEAAHAEIATRAIANPARIVDCLAPGTYSKRA